MKKRHLKSAVLALAACAGLASCVKDEYDLSKDMDLNVTIGGDLALPVGNTEDITLDQAIDLDDNKLDTIAAGRDYTGTLMEGMECGDYFFYTSSADDDSRNTFKIKPIIVNLKPTDEFNTKEDINIDASSELSKIKIPGYENIDLNSTTILDNHKITIPNDFNDEEIADMDDFEQDFDFDNSISHQIVRLDDIEFELHEEGNKASGRPVYIEMTIFIVGGDNKNFRIKKGTEFKLPSWATFDLSDNADLAEKKGTNPDENIIYLTKDFEIPTNGSNKLSLRLVGLDCEGAVNENDRGHFYRKGNLEINGQVSLRLPVKGKEMTVGQLKKDLKATFKVHAQLNNPSINVTRAYGMFEPDEIDVKNFEINNMPDIINDKDTRIFITNPAIRFTVPQDQRMTVQTMTLNNLSITAQFNDGTPAHKEDISQLSMDESQDKSNRYVLINRAATGKNIEVFNALLNVINHNGRIPNNIDINIENARIEGMLQPDTEYLIEYEFLMPLSFQNGKINDEIVRTQLAYNDTIDGWNEDIADDIDKIKEAKGVTARATAVNTTPFELVVKDIKVIDINGKELKDVKVTNFKDIKITPGADTPVVVDIDCNADQLTKIDGIVYSVAAIVGDQYQDVTLNNRKHRLSLRNAHIQLKGGITVDLND